MTDNAQNAFPGALPSGTVIGDLYRIDRPIGRGGFGITYLAHFGAYDQPCVVKEYLPAQFASRANDGDIAPNSRDAAIVDVFERGREDFVSEGKRLKEARHRNVVGVIDHKVERGTAYLIMDFVEGRSLTQALLDRGPLTGPETAAVLSPILDALEHVHSKGLLHRDISPNNIMLRDKDDQPILIDFGAARHAVAIHSRDINTVSDGFSPPEQYDKSVRQTPAADLYALGAVAHWMLTKAAPPSGEQRMLSDGMAGWAERRPELRSRLIVPLVNRMTALDAAERPQSAAEARAALAPLVEVWSVMDRLRAAEGTKRLSFTERTDGSLAVEGDVASRDVAETVLSMLQSAAPGLRIDEAIRSRGSEPVAHDAPRPTTPVANAAPVHTQPDALRREAPAKPPEQHDAPTTTARRSPVLLLGGAAAVLAAGVVGGSALLNWDGGEEPTGDDTAPTEIAAGASGPVPANEASCGVDIALERAVYRIGEPFQFDILSRDETRSCDFLVYTVDASNAVELFDPSENADFMGAERLSAGEMRQIPVKGAPGGAFVEGPVGTYRIGIVSSRDDLASVGLDLDTLRGAAEGGFRNFEFRVDAAAEQIDEDRLNRMTVAYEVVR